MRKTEWRDINAPQGGTLGRPSFQERTEHKDKRPSGELVVLNLWLTSKSMNGLIANYEAVYSSNG